VRAVIMAGPREVVVEHVEDPSLPGGDGAIIRVEATSICGSDLHPYIGEMDGWMQRGWFRRPGHEFVGTVVEAGPDVRTVGVADRVFVLPEVACGRCARCRAGEVLACSVEPGFILGVHPAWPGGQAEYAAVPRADLTLRPIPAGVSDETAVLLTDALPTGYYGAVCAEIGPGSSAVVFGLGPVGLFAVQSALLRGASRVFAVDLLADRRARAEAVGAIPIDATQGDVVATIRDLNDGQLVDGTVEAAGVDETLVQALAVTREYGAIGVIAAHADPKHGVLLGKGFTRSQTVRTHVTPLQRVVDEIQPLVAAGRFVTDGIFTHVHPLSEASKAYELFADRRDGCLKVLLDPTT